MKSPIKRLPQTFILLILRGLSLGKRLVHSVISHRDQDLTGPESLNSADPAITKVQSALAPLVPLIRQFLYKNNYIVTGTDKNLGIAVSECEWYNTQCMKLLGSEADYCPILLHEVNFILHQQCESMELLAIQAKALSGIWPGSKQLPGFFWSKVIETGKDHHIPCFHGIPKIHKTPTGMWPIVPCHSAIINPAAKFVSKILKPLIQRAETVLQSSCQFCIDLSKIMIPKGKTTWLVSGDVVAFYPNVPLDHALDIVSKAVRGYYHTVEGVADDHPFWDIFNHALVIQHSILLIMLLPRMSNNTWIYTTWCLTSHWRLLYHSYQL